MEIKGDDLLFLFGQEPVLMLGFQCQTLWSKE